MKPKSANDDPRKEVRRLLRAVRWALGEVGDFEPRKEGQGVYWWRTGLRRRAGLRKSGKAVAVQVLSTKERGELTRAQLKQRALPVSQGGTRPDDMDWETWRTSQGSFYDDDRC